MTVRTNRDERGFKAFRAHAVLLTAALVTTGCGDGSRSGAMDFDPAAVRASLTDTLNAWKKGEVKTLSTRKPPIRFMDADQASGFRLVDYSIAEPDAPVEPNVDIAVHLSLRDATGKAIRRDAVYQITTAPNLAVHRRDR